MKRHLLLGLTFLAAAGCSKSSAKPATKEGKEDVFAKRTPEDLCDDACTAIGVCTERLNPDEHFRSGLACSENCMAMSPSAREAWVKEMVDAERKNDCKRVIQGAPDFVAEEEEAAMFDGATLPDGELPLGCFAWSEQLRAVACVVGDNGNDGVELTLAFVGGDSNKLAPLPLVKGPLGTEARVEATTAVIANDRLAAAGFTPITAKATTLANRKPKTINGVTFRFTQIEKEPGGDNIAPTHSYGLLALWEGRKFQVLDTEGEGLTATSTVRQLDSSRLLVETKQHVGREGEFNDTVDVAVLDLASGKLMR